MGFLLGFLIGAGTMALCFWIADNPQAAAAKVEAARAWVRGLFHKEG